jgi:HSP20 family protein
MREKKALAASPFGLLRQMTSELDRMFEDPWTFRWPALPAEAAATFAPKVDVFEKENRLITRVDLPGVKKEDVTVEVADGLLTLTGERKTEKEETKDNVYRSECQYGSFYRSVPLPEGVKAEDVKATFVNGVLEVSVPLPVAPAKPAATKIEVKEAAPGAAKAAA